MSASWCKRHIWKSYGFGKRTDKPDQITGFFECLKCHKRKQTVSKK